MVWQTEREIKKQHSGTDNSRMLYSFGVMRKENKLYLKETRKRRKKQKNQKNRRKRKIEGKRRIEGKKERKKGSETKSKIPRLLLSRVRRISRIWKVCYTLE